MTTEKLEIINMPNDCELITVREVSAKVETVFKAWTDPTYLDKWWGPRDFITITHSQDLKPGGHWVFTIRGEGRDFPNECVYVKIKPNQIVWNHISGHFFQVVANFETISTTQTRVTFKMIFENAAECERISAFAKDKNEENMDKLVMVLKEMKSE